MDCGNNYILMCEKAEEIQRLWKPKDGDYAWHPNEGDDYMGYWEFPTEIAIVKVTESKSAQWWLHWLWLPRQDELQEIYHGGCLIVAGLLQLIWEFMRHNIKYVDSFTSMEQLWLAFVMKERWNKVWNGEKWEESVKD